MGAQSQGKAGCTTGGASAASGPWRPANLGQGYTDAIGAGGHSFCVQFCLASLHVCWLVFLFVCFLIDG